MFLLLLPLLAAIAGAAVSDGEVSTEVVPRSSSATRTVPDPPQTVSRTRLSPGPEATLTEARLPAAQGFKQRDEVPPWGETVYFSTIVYYSSGTTIYESGTASGSLPIMSPPSWVFSPSEHSSLSSTQSFPPSPSASGTSDAFSLTSSSQIASSSTTPRGFSSSSSVAAYTSSQGTVPSSTTTQLYSPGVSSVSRYTTQKSVLPSPSLRSTAAVSDRHSSGGASATSATSAPKSAARVVPLRLVLAIVVTVLAVLMLGALGVYARRRWRTRLATKERIAEPFFDFGDEKSGMRQAGGDEGPFAQTEVPSGHQGPATGRLDARSAGPINDLTLDIRSGDAIAIDAPSSSQTLATASDVCSEHPSREHVSHSVEGPPLREHDSIGLDIIPHETRLPPDIESSSQCPSTPPPYAHTPFSQRFSVSSASGTLARPIGPRQPLISYAQLYGGQTDEPDEQMQGAENIVYPRQAEDGGISLAGGPLRRREDAGGRSRDRTELGLCEGVSFDKPRGSVSTSGSRTLPPPYQER